MKKPRNAESAPPARYAVGIDLGTTNSVLAYADLAREDRKIELLPLPQLLAANTVENRPTLPSFLYLASDSESENSSYDLAWGRGRDYAVGEFARKQAADAPARVVSSAKSWLAHSRVDRRQAILPWGAPPEVKKVSPVEAVPPLSRAHRFGMERGFSGCAFRKPASQLDCAGLV